MTVESVLAWGNQRQRFPISFDNTESLIGVAKSYWSANQIERKTMMLIVVQCGFDATPLFRALDVVEDNRGE